MDPLSQGVLGAVVAQSFTRKNRHLRLAAAVGWIAGMAADLDILIRSQDDPLLSLEYHRHFTHSLAFIPIGGVLVGLFCWLITKRRYSLPAFIGFATLGFATHGLLDAFTSYGTQLLWPFSDVRIAWDSIAIIDLFFTVPLLVGMFASIKTSRAFWARAGFGVACLWMSFGAYQHHVLTQAQQALAESRGHTIIRGRVMPSLAILNPLGSWRSVYRSGETLYTDSLKFRLSGAPIVTTGESIPYFDAPAFAATLPSESPLAHDLRRYSWFADGFTALLPTDPTVVIDVRYSPTLASTRPLWGISMDLSAPDKHVRKVRFPRL